MGLGSACFRWLADVGEADTVAGRALLEERYRALQRQIPLLYIVALTNFLGLHAATGGELGVLISPASLLVLFVLVRLVHWLRVRRTSLPPEKIERELRRTWAYALFVSLGFALWALHLLDRPTADPLEETHVILFGSMAAVGCAYGLSSFPAAARLPLLFLGLPLAVRMIVSGTAAHVGIGISLALVILLILRLLGIHNNGFAQLVDSRSQISVERERAVRAERLAKTEKAKVKKVADTDPLTGLANRRAFLRVLSRRASTLSRGGSGFALALVDLDGFKPINDTFGHATGDSLLEQVGARLESVGADGTVVARMGGDEFALLIAGCSSEAAARSAGTGICAALQEPFAVEGHEFRISGCCGLALLSAEQSDADGALIRADTALYRAKEAGRAGVAIFSPEMDKLQQRRTQIEKALRISATHEQVRLVFQPIRTVETGELRAFEALARWDHPELGAISPDEFIPIAEQINVIKELSDSLLARAATEATRWADSIRLSFNLSAVQLCTGGAAKRILSILEQAGLEPRRLQVEVTETALLVDFVTAGRNLDELRHAGIRIVLDDFGAGHASISYLREMQFDGVKLDGSLVTSVTESIRSRRLLKGVLDLCASLRLPCVAEHVETEEQLQVLRELGCRDAQGYLLAAPMTPEKAAELAVPAILSLPSRRVA